MVALTHDYGYRLSYWGFISPRLWATQGDQAVDRLSGTAEKPFAEQFSQSTQGYDYFLVTLNQLLTLFSPNTASTVTLSSEEE